MPKNIGFASCLHDFLTLNARKIRTLLSINCYIIFSDHVNTMLQILIYTVLTSLIEEPHLALCKLKNVEQPKERQYENE